MWSDTWGCKIQQSGSSGSCTYTVATDWANRPVTDVSWRSTARFANWLHNGQPSGLQDMTTTEDGSYLLNGAMTDVELAGVARKPDATWVMPTEDEWYKAGYHKNDGVTGNYWDYPTGTSTVPSNTLSSTGTNNANFSFTMSGPPYSTEAGEFAHSSSPYGTFDQAGNAWEWNETLFYSSSLNLWYHGLRGGSFYYGEFQMRAACRGIDPLSEGYGHFGFRVAEVPEPGSAVLLFASGLALLRRRRRD